MNLDFKFIFVLGLSVFTVRSEEAPKCENEDSFSIFSHIDCSRFWQCFKGQAVLWKCPTGLYFNKNINVCDWPENVDCSYNNSNNDNNEQDGDTQNNNNDNNEEDGDTQNNYGENNNEKDRDTQKHIEKNKEQYGDKNNINDNNNEEDGDSQNNNDDVNNNEQDEDTQNDDDDNNNEQDEGRKNSNEKTKEQDRDRRNNNDNNNKEDGDTQNNNDDNNNEQDDNNEDKYDLGHCEGIECPAKNGDVVSHISGPDCTKFCKCSHGVAYLQTCPPGLYFNSVLQVCDFPESSNCVQKDDVRNDKKNDDIGNEIDKNNQDNNQPEQCDDVECPLEDADSVLYKPGPDCATFCKCYRGIAYLENCPADLYFNPTWAVCDFQDKSGCVNNNDKVPDGVDNKIADDVDNKIADDVDNDEDGLNEVDDNDEIVCLQPCIEEDGLSPASNCDNFCLCSNGEQHIMTCPSYLEFNAKDGFCDWPGNSGCRKNGL